MDFPEKFHPQLDIKIGGDVDSNLEWAIADFGFTRLLKPILARPESEYIADDEEKDEYLSTTPTCAESRFASKLQCPPAPKKLKSAPKGYHNKDRGVSREFFRPPDQLEAIFFRR
ncbi:GMP synthase [Striga asiatica]|uniref:GMP synthase n=1 Tax=Striga asiatica TaxID=4170 RepID=A0A5A7RE91_STRAF|nr:GMP synthase [Striga asiatica]